MFFSFEGIRCCGKTTQIEAIRKILEFEGKQIVVIPENGGTVISKKIWEILNSDDKGISFSCEMLLHLVLQTQLVEERIIPALGQQKIVFCDRFTEALIAFYVHAREICTMGDFLSIKNILPNLIEPDVTFLLDVSVEESMKREQIKEIIPSRMRARVSYPKFLEREREGYLTAQCMDSKRILIIDGMRKPEVITEDILDIIKSTIPQND